jgi:hypothetical protein
MVRLFKEAFPITYGPNSRLYLETFAEFTVARIFEEVDYWESTFKINGLF